MRKYRRLVVMVVVLTALGAIGLMIFNTLRGSESSTEEITLTRIHGSETEIRDWLLGLAPIGSTYSEVRELIEEMNWEFRFVSTQDPVNDIVTLPVEGVHIVRAYLGGFQGSPWYVDVDSTWGFDEEKILIDLLVRRMEDSP